MLFVGIILLAISLPLLASGLIAAGPIGWIILAGLCYGVASAQTYFWEKDKTNDRR